MLASLPFAHSFLWWRQNTQIRTAPLWEGTCACVLALCTLISLVATKYKNSHSTFMGRNVCLRPCPLRTHFFGGYKCRSLHSTLMGREVCLRPCPLRTHFFDGDRTQKFAQHLDGKGSVLCSFVTLELRGCFDVRRHWTRVKIRGV